MALDISDRIVIPVEDGEEHLFEVRYIFEPDHFEHSYVVVTPVGEDEESFDEEEEVEAFAFRFIEHGDGEDDLELFALETDEEWDMIEEMLATVEELEEE
ncbi:DUF1292 domain-containing protein [Pueribacillus theae]|uniref:UPF0473 protein DCC39_05785 n=1 Tax=Pueribacillus theae TaxID=2171751 RepID=A0A2U1K567_9BACI|nr:DUF1292 domain-containing protein [Pueribacillus theae]PWA12522.1 DUF1292 domain-containing protein [Pueribacillus theae]